MPKRFRFVPGIATEGGAETPLHGAAWVGAIAAAKRLVKAGADVNAIDSAGETPLHGAAACGQADMVKYLLSAGANPNIAEAVGLTPLHWAASHGNVETAQALVVAGADVNVKNQRGNTPLQEAKERNRTTLVKYLRTVATNSALLTDALRPRLRRAHRAAKRER